MTIKKPMTPVVEAIGKLNITGNVTPHVWYLRSEFRTDSGRPDRNMITAMADILYWFRPREVRDEERGGIFVGYERKFAREMLQYDYERRGSIFGMSKREMQEACTKLAKRGLIRIEYVTERYRTKVLHNVVYIEPLPEAVATTLSGPNVEPVTKAKGAVRGRHVKKEEYDPNSGVDDQTPREGIDGHIPPPSDKDTEGETATSQNSGELNPEGSSQNFEGATSQNSEQPPPEFWDTYHESSSETSFSRDFKNSSSIQVPALPAQPQDDDEKSADARKEQNPTPEAPHSPDQGQTQTQGGGTQAEPGVEKVPGAAGGGAAAGESAILALVPIPRAELEARSARDPEGMRTLRALMQATNPGRLGHLREQLSLTTVGAQAVPRSLLLRLTDAEIEAARKAAQADAKIVRGGMGNAGYYALDALIGEQFTLARLKGEQEVRQRDVRGPESVVKNEGARKPAPAAEAEPAVPTVVIEAGSRWEHRRIPDRIVTVVEVVAGKAELHNGEQIFTYQLGKDYRRVD